jgi:outer membrane receptor protein involved in Fe transport
MSTKKLISPILFLALIFTGFLFAQDSGLEEVTVTAQRQEQSLQDVPLSVTAFSADDLLEQQIEEASDLQLVVPGLTFTPSAFSGGGGFDIRGITNLAVSATADAGVAIHMNDLALGATTLQDGTFFDMARIEVIRGPAGTLFGRNSVGGAINMISAKADTTGFYGNASIDIADYNGLKTTSTFNIPLDDKVALRLATSTVNRDGYMENIYSELKDQDVDGRNQLAYRATLSFEPSDNTTIHLIHNVEIEDSTRTLGGNVYCKRDTSFVTGCTRTSERAFELTHPMGTYVDNLMVAMGVLDFVTTSDMSGAPQGYRQQNTRGNPYYEVDQYTTQLLIEHSIDDIDISIGAHSKDRKFMRMSVYSSPEMQSIRFKDTAATPGGLINMSGYGPGCNLDAGTLGVYGGCIMDTLNYATGGDRPESDEDTKSLEMKVSSNFIGNLNFLAGYTYFDNKSMTLYDVYASGLDVLGQSPPALLVGAPSAALGAQLYPSLYRTNALSTTESHAVFGELYFEPQEDLKLTFGLRYNEDEKTSLSRIAFVNVLGFEKGRATDFAVNTLSVGAIPTAAAFEAISCAGVDQGFCPLAGSVPDYGEAYIATTGLDPFMEFSALTGRFVVDYFVDENTMIYANLSKGFKGGGFNPALDPLIFPNTPQIFPASDLISLEFGFKTEFPDQGVRLNGALYAYDAENYHITKIMNKTSINEGIDVDIMGLELELLYAPPSVPGLALNASVAMTQSTIADGVSALDPVQPDGAFSGHPDSSNWHLMKDELSTMFIMRKDALAAVYGAWLQETVTGGAAQTGLDQIVALSGGTTSTADLMAALIPAEFHGDRTYGQPTPVSYLVPELGLTPADGHLPSLGVQAGMRTMAQLLGFDPAEVVSEGLETDISGNSLVHPDASANVGIAYTAQAGSVNITTRIDVAYQGPRYVRIFNLPEDRIDSWLESNLQITVTPTNEDSWYVQFYGQNITDELNVTGIGLGDASVGQTRGVTVRDPQVFGFRVGYNF